MNRIVRELSLPVLSSQGSAHVLEGGGGVPFFRRRESFVATHPVQGSEQPLLSNADGCSPRLSLWC